MLGQVTAKPEQLSPESTDKALAFVASFNVTVLDESAMADVAEVASNLLTASVNQFAALNATSEAVEERARRRSNMLTKVVDSLASTMAASLVHGEAETTLFTKTFAMAVKADLPANFEGRELAGGAVRVPTGALGGGTSSVAAKVVTWVDAGPLFHVKDQSPANQAGSKMESSLLSVSFVDDAGAEMSVVNLSDPFVVTLSTSRGTDGTASCAHWNVGSNGWVADGVLLNETADNMTCAFAHLTSFGGFMPPVRTHVPARRFSSPSMFLTESKSILRRFWVRRVALSWAGFGLLARADERARLCRRAVLRRRLGREHPRPCRRARAIDHDSRRHHVEHVRIHQPLQTRWQAGAWPEGFEPAAGKSTRSTIE